MAHIAKDSDFGPASLYKAFAPGAKPRFDTVVKVMGAMGVELHAQAVYVPQNVNCPAFS